MVCAGLVVVLVERADRYSVAVLTPDCRVHLPISHRVHILSPPGAARGARAARGRGARRDAAGDAGARALPRAGLELHYLLY